MVWAVALLLAFLPPGSQTSDLEGGMMSITRNPGAYAVITCDIQKEDNYIHWYLFKEGQAPHRVLYYDFFTSKVVVDSGFDPGKYHAYEGSERSYKFVLRNVEESDSGVYYCAVWPGTWVKHISIRLGHIFVFWRIFSPDVIKVYWKRTDDNRILESQQGETMKINDTYMKFSWLTVTRDSMTKEHKCIVKHEANVGADQEILFAPKKEVVANDSEACFKHETGLQGLQLTSTSTYYTYLLLLLKSALHGALVVFCLCRASPVCCDRKST